VPERERDDRLGDLLAREGHARTVTPYQAPTRIPSERSESSGVVMPEAAETVKRPAHLIVATFNVLDFAHADGSARRRVIAAGLRELDPDLIALQEVDVDDPNATVHQLLGDGYHAVPHPSSRPGVAAILACRWPLADVEVLDLRLTPACRRFGWARAVIARVEAPDPIGSVLVAHHKPIWEFGMERERELQAVHTAAAIEERMAAGVADHAIVLGDFDAEPHAASLRFWTGRQSLEEVSVSYRDAWEAAHPDVPGYTFTPDNPLVTTGQMPLTPPRRIDYILVRAGGHGPTLEVASSRLLFDAPVDGVQASDHYGVIAELAPSPHPPGRWA
jgi:endonuclease/exonuclease/phosphatase family metal-dependent hydrolase